MAGKTPVHLSDDQVALLREKVLAHVVTTMPDGSPHVTPVWVDSDGEAVVFNTAKGRIKHRNLVRDPRIAISVTDKQNDYRTVVIRGRAEFVDEGADANIDKMAKKYLDADSYPNRREGEQRVIVRVVPEQILGR
jgi:PPOX class probable F420-dependent enzyme